MTLKEPCVVYHQDPADAHTAHQASACGMVNSLKGCKDTNQKAKAKMWL